MIESQLMEGLTVPSREVQGFRPLTATLEWQLADVHWAQAGVQPFMENQVPHLVTSSGRLSHQAAQVLYQSCLESPPSGTLRVLELGAGTGLFARHFLHAFRDLCAKGQQDFYQRLRYVVTDRSARTVAQWAEHGLFDEHAGQVQSATCDALNPTGWSDLRAVLCNYLLDTLPARLLRRGPGGVTELRLRTNLIADDATVRSYTPLGVAELRALAQSPDPHQQARLLPLLTLLEPETAYLPCDPAEVPLLAEALELCPQAGRVLLSEGALRCLEASLKLLTPDGFLLLNDYGPLTAALPRELAAPLRLGATMALGVNFLLLEAWLERRGWRVLRPPGDEDMLLHARLLLAAPRPQLEEAFAAAFSTASQQHIEGPLAEARQHLGAGRLDEALRCYRAAVQRSPRDFLVLGEAAEFAASHLRDFAIGLELAQAALLINPWYGGWMWNVCGDCLLGLGRTAEAHQAYLRAARIHPGDPRAHMNLSLTFSHQGDLAEALLALARALAHDGQGAYRARLLDQQQQLLSLVANRAAGEHERLLRRSERLRSALAE